MPKLIKKINTKVKQIQTKVHAVRPKIQKIISGMDKKYNSPNKYREKTINKLSSEFSKLSKALKPKELPVDPSTVKLKGNDSLHNQKEQFLAKQIIGRQTNSIVPRRVGNHLEIKLSLIVRNKKISVSEKKQKLRALTKEIDTFTQTHKIKENIKILETELGKNADRITNIFKETNEILKSKFIKVSERKEISSFLESWRRNLRNNEALLREYKHKKENLDLLKKQIDIIISKLK